MICLQKCEPDWLLRDEYRGGHISVQEFTVCITGGAGCSSETSGKGELDSAIVHYTEAISLDGSNHILFNNRSAAYARVGNFTAALEDAKRCQQLKPDWPMVSTMNLCHYSVLAIAIL